MVAYVRHEEEIRRSLRSIAAEGKSVTKWRREFVLSDLKRLTRSNIHKEPVVRVSSATAGWIWPRFAYITEDTVNDNRVIVNDFFKGLHAHGQVWEHDRYEGVPLQLVSGLIADYRTAAPNDTVRLEAARERISEILRTGTNAVDIYYMRNRVFRTASLEKGIEQLFQGRGRTTDYPGDRSIITPDRITLQIHEIDVRIDGATVGQHVPVLALHFPDRSVDERLIQPTNRIVTTF
jgi:hypothetical protein